MNISRFLTEKLRDIRNSDGNLKQILILTSLAVIFGGFGNMQGFVPSYGMPGPQPEFDGFGGMDFQPDETFGYNEEGYAPWNMGPFGQGTARPDNRKAKGKNFGSPIRHKPETEAQNPNRHPDEGKEKYTWVETDKRKKHKHHHHEEKEEKIPFEKPEDKYNNEGYAEDINSSEVPYTIE